MPELLGLLPGAPVHVTDRIPLALVPGLLTDRALWAHQIEALADLAESRVADFTTQGSIAGMARSVLEMMPARFALAGLSMGGYVAMEVLRQAPERAGPTACPDRPRSPVRRWCSAAVRPRDRRRLPKVFGRRPAWLAVPAPPRHALLTENLGPKDWGKPSL